MFLYLIIYSVTSYTKNCLCLFNNVKIMNSFTSSYIKKCPIELQGGDLAGPDEIQG